MYIHDCNVWHVLCVCLQRNWREGGREGGRGGREELKEYIRTFFKGGVFVFLHVTIPVQGIIDSSHVVLRSPFVSSCDAFAVQSFFLFTICTQLASKTY